MTRKDDTAASASEQRPYKVQPSEVPVVVIRKAFPGIQIRLLADRDAGVVQWESYLLNDAGEVVSEIPIVKLGLEILLNLEGIADALLEARDALTPRRRLDMARLEEPDDTVPPSIQQVK